MNLAELRKKAQKGKPAKVQPPVDSLRDLDQVDEALAEATERAVQLDEQLPDADSESFFDQEVFGVDSAKADEEVSSAFDPLAVLLEGRANALADEGMLADAAAAAETVSDELQEFLCFKVSSEIYAINIMDIKEIIKPREVTEVPRVPAFVSGVLSLRGIIIPIFNMRLRLGLASVEKSAKERIIVLRKNDEFYGILVDEVIHVVKIVAASIEKPPAVLDGIDRDFVSGIGRFDGQMLILLNQEKILDLTLG